MTTPQASGPPPRARPEIHTKVLELVDQLGQPNGRKVLDAPLGPGALARELLDRGWSVSGVDIDLAQSDHLGDRAERVRANLNGPLPFADESFDLVTSLEGIEHVENHFHVLRELARVAKPGGVLVITTPNIGNIEERLNFLSRGSFYKYITAEDQEKHGSGFSHQNLLTYLELRQVVDWAGFEITTIEKDRPKWKQNVFLFPFYCLIKAYQAFQSAKRVAKYRIDEANCDNVLMGGPTVILVARKRR